MPTIAPLPAKKLRVALEMERIPWESTQDIPRKTLHHDMNHILQPRAFEAIKLALNITAEGYHVYLSGDAHVGRGYTLREFLTPYSRHSATPPDIIYLNNFTNTDKPCIISLCAGQGRKLKETLHEVLSKIRKELPRRFEADAFMKQRAKLLDIFQDARTALLKKMDAIAENKGFNLDMDERGSLTLYPIVDGKRLSEDEFDQLDTTLRQELNRKGDTLLHTLASLMRQLTRAEQTFRHDERALEREVIRQVLDSLLNPVEKRLLESCKAEALKEHFVALRQDILDNPDAFLPRDPLPIPNAMAASHSSEGHIGLQVSSEQDLARYDINLFVDNSKTQGAPIIFEEHPTATNLLGCIERESEMGALVTDFTLIKAGSLHKANGGFLIIRMEDILQNFHAWEGLLRSLRTGLARIEDIDDGHDTAMRTKGIEPAPLALNLKVILIGNDALYESLISGDERFGKLFRIKAHLADQTARNAAGIKAYMYRLCKIIDEANLLPFDKSGLAWMVDYGSYLIEEQKKLSLKFPLLREIMIEASALATMNKHTLVNKDILDMALQAKIYRMNFVEEIFMEEYDRELIKVRTSGTAIGRVNGLSVTWHGDFEFGLPHQISCAVGVGHDGIIDLEREAELGGPIHTKAMMILTSYLVAQFARRKPLVLTGSLCFEQSYAGIEGDSASGAELVALLSAIAEVPVRLDIAITGALSQSGEIMAVGGVTRKIEGFFKVCARQGLTGTQGVIIPYDNVTHLMLSPKIIDAVQNNTFAIYPVKHIDQALELLTGINTGKRRKDDTFTANSLYDLVDKRLKSLGAYASSKSQGRRS